MRAALLLALLSCSCHRDEVKADDPAPPKKVVKKVTRTACVFPEGPVDFALKFAERCEIRIERDVRIERGGDIAIGAGSRITFAEGAGMHFAGGTLHVRGTRDEPVLFTGQKESPGSWMGLYFPQPSPAAVLASDRLESSIEHAVVEYAGGEGRATNAGIVVTARTVAHLSLSHVTFRNNASRGLYVYDVASWAGGNDLVFRKNGGLSFDGDPDVLAETKGLEVDEPIHVWGVATRPLVMPRVPAIRIRRLIVDGQKGSGASVAFPEGSIVKMDAGGEIKIGSAFPAHDCAFTARNVTFESGAVAPAAGDWVSIQVLADCEVTLDGATVRHAQKGVEVGFGLKRVSIERTRFTDLVGAAITADDCAPFSKGNTATGKLCELGGLGLSGIGVGGYGLGTK
jgi:hypothetical protein